MEPLKRVRCLIRRKFSVLEKCWAHTRVVHVMSSDFVLRAHTNTSHRHSYQLKSRTRSKRSEQKKNGWKKVCEAIQYREVSHSILFYFFRFDKQRQIWPQLYTYYMTQIVAEK